MIEAVENVAYLVGFVVLILFIAYVCFGLLINIVSMAKTLIKLSLEIHYDTKQKKQQYKELKAQIEAELKAQKPKKQFPSSSFEHLKKVAP